MTKEEFIERVKNVASMYDTNTPSGTACVRFDVEKLCDEFFKDKVIIKRGENRRPYADVLHELAEDTTKDVEIATHHCNNIGRDEYIFDSVFRIPNNPLRIKPKEPIYEWQWLEINDGRVEVTNFYTEDEVGRGCSVIWKKIEETKRERK